MMTNLTLDRVERLQRVVLGDFSATSGGLGSGLLMGGFKVEKSFSLAPHLIRYPGLGVEGVLETPSTVEVYVNNSLIKRLELPPGEFHLTDLHALPGTGQIRLLIRDALGREEVIERPFYIPSRTLGPGVSEYSIAAGFRRKYLGFESFHYGGPVFLGFLRRGFTDFLTGTIRGEADKNTLNGGIETTIRLLSRAELTLSTALSNSDMGTGYGGSLNFNLPIWRGMSSSIRLRGFSESYADLSTLNSSRRPALDWAVRLNLGKRHLGSLSTVYSSTRYHDSPETKRLSIHYERGVWRYGTLYLTASREWYPSGREDSITFGLLIPLGMGHYTSLKYRTHDGRATTLTSLYKNPLKGPGIGYRLQVERMKDQGADWRTYARVEHHLSIGHLSADYWKAGTKDRINLSLSGAIVFTSEGIYPSAPIRDGFALVDTTGVDGVRVKLNGQYMGKTFWGGKLVVPELVSYHDSTLSISSKELPMEFRVKESIRHVAPYYRSGGVVRFDIERFRAVEGRIYWYERGRKAPVEFASLEVRAGERTIKTVTGKNGAFYIEGLSGGEYPARVFRKGRECSFTLRVPDTGETFVNIGEVVCE